MSKEHSTEPIPYLEYGNEASYLTHLRVGTLVAFRTILEEEEYVPLLERFRFTYEMRRKNPKLGESGQRTDIWKDRGLGFAVSCALTTLPHEDDQPIIIGRTEVDDIFLEEIGQQVNSIVRSNLVTFGMLQAILESQGIDSQNVDGSVLRSHIASSMRTYCNQGLRGYGN